jgi:type IV secretory pathway VirB10-like protein
MGQDAFVDVAYRGLEVGRRLKLHDVGPNTGYLEHGAPMPVGSGLIVRTDEGLSIPVVVIRVHEQVAGAEMAPGMRIRADALEGAEASWWQALVSRDDPEVPELPMAPVVPMPRLDQAEAGPPEPPEPPESPEAPEEPAPQAHDTMIMDVPELAAVLAAAERGGNGAAAKRDAAPAASRTVVMSTAEIEKITSAEGQDEGQEGDEAGEPAPAEAESGGNGAPGSNGDELRGKARGRRRRRRR